MPDLVFKLRVEDASTLAQLQGARRDLNKFLKEGLIVAGTKAVLPRVRRIAPQVISTNLKSGAVVRGGYITTQGSRKQDRIVGLLNWGGVVTTQIVPKRKQAIKVGSGGIIRANVKGPRRYQAKHFIERGIDESLPALAEATLPSIMKAFGGMDHTP